MLKELLQKMMIDEIIKVDIAMSILLKQLSEGFVDVDMFVAEDVRDDFTNTFVLAKNRLGD